MNNIHIQVHTHVTCICNHEGYFDVRPPNDVRVIIFESRCRDNGTTLRRLAAVWQKAAMAEPRWQYVAESRDGRAAMAVCDAMAV